jgi:RNA polymerase sigma-70 factor (ECF subfamily)
MSELLSRTTLHRARTLLKDMVAKLTMREEHCLAG